VPVLARSVMYLADDKDIEGLKVPTIHLCTLFSTNLEPSRPPSGNLTP
jgi:hypothetical protein